MKIERKKLILIIAVITTLVLLILVVGISLLTGGKNNNKPTQSPTTSVTDSPSNSNTPSDVNTSQAAPIGDPTASGAPPATAYENDYSKDTGYTPLPKGFDGSSNPANTVYDQNWALAKMQTLACELSTKPTSTEKALTPLNNFYLDLGKVSYANAKQMRLTINSWIEGYTPYIGERAPGDIRNNIISYCANSSEQD